MLEKVLNQGKRKLVFHLGVNAGFFSEYNNMLLAMVFCLQDEIRFTLYSKDANFGFNCGWQDYFLPFCKEVKCSFHHKYNYRSLAEYNHFKSNRLDNKIKFYKTISGTDFLTFELFDRFRSEASSDQNYEFPELGISGNLRSICAKLVKMTWRYNYYTERKINAIIENLNLPDEFVGIHVRRGDKDKEIANSSEEKYIQIAETHTNIRIAFIATDDFSVVNKFEEKFHNWKFFFLCKESHTGYYQDDFQQMDKQEKRNYILELFASIEILKKSNLFIGTYSSNIGMFMGMVLPVDKCYGVDFETWKIW